MKEGYYKIVDVEYTSGNGVFVQTQNIHYYDNDEQLIIIEHYNDSVRPEFNELLPE